MKCSKCGSEIPEGSKFCPVCGTAQNPVPAADGMNAVPGASGAAEQSAASEGKAENTAGPQQEAQKPVQTQPEASGKKQGSFHLNGKLVGGLAAIVVVVIVAAVLVLTHKPTVDLSKYITISFDGYDTVGTASYSFDDDALYQDYGKKIKVNKRAVQKALKDSDLDDQSLLGGDYLTELMSNMSIYDYFNFVGADGTVEPEDGLSNGDEVTFSWSFSEKDLEELGEMFGCKFKADDVTEKVDGLEEAEDFDPFDGVEVSYSGMSPNGTVSNISAGNGAACADLYYEADKTDGLSNGDTITVTVESPTTEDLTQYCLEHYGEIPTETSKQFTVDGLSSYVMSASEIPDDMMKKMQAQAEDAFNAKMASNWVSKDDETSELKKLQYIGNYFLSSKDTQYDYENDIYLVYKVRAHVFCENTDGDSYDDNVDYYWYCKFSDIVLLSDGTCSVDLSNYNTADSKNFTVKSNVDAGFWSEYVWYFYGYQSLDSMFNQVVTTQIDRYKYEDNVRDVDFGKDKTDASKEKSSKNTDTSAVPYDVTVDASDGGIWLREDAGTEYDKLMDEMIPTGTKLTITAEKKSSAGDLWGQTEYNGQSGWVYLAATQKASE